MLTCLQQRRKVHSFLCPFAQRLTFVRRNFYSICHSLGVTAVWITIVTLHNGYYWIQGKTFCIKVSTKHFWVWKWCPLRTCPLPIFMSKTYSRLIKFSRTIDSFGRIELLLVWIDFDLFISLFWIRTQRIIHSKHQIYVLFCLVLSNFSYCAMLMCRPCLCLCRCVCAFCPCFRFSPVNCSC